MKNSQHLNNLNISLDFFTVKMLQLLSYNFFMIKRSCLRDKKITKKLWQNLLHAKPSVIVKFWIIEGLKG